MRNLKLPVITLVILVLNLIGYVLELTLGSNQILYDYGMYQGALQDGEWYRLITSSFLHFDPIHLLCNMFCLVSFGMLLEDGIGRIRFTGIYVAGILGAGLFIQYAGGPYSLHAGASGAIWALMGAALVYILKYHGSPVGIIRSILLNLFYSFSSGVSWQGHIGGGIAGLAAALILLNLKPPKNGKAYRKWKKSHPGVSDEFFNTRDE